MKDALKRILSKRFIVIVLVALLVLSAFNTYLIFEGTRIPAQKLTAAPLT
jgi:hypothetical protein